MSATTVAEVRDPARLRPVYVFEAPVRVWHWVHALSILILAATGWLIANPLPSVPGEASANFWMGNIRLIHFIAGYVFAIGFLLRAYWAVVGNPYARELFVLPVWRPSWWQGIFHELRFYGFLTDAMHRETGHNPLAQSSYFVFNVVLTLFMIVSGFALYGEGLGLGSWADRLFGWVIPLIGDAEAVHNWHNVGMWLMITFVIIHVYMAVRGEIMSRQSSISTIVGGWRYFKDDRP
jgi:Ni/Fe-hydrogenase 1 B-type cytochrome subunit